MLTKHEDHTCKDCKEKFQSLMEVLKHASKHHVNDKDEVNDIKDQGEEVVQNKEHQEIIELKRIKRNKNKEKTEKEEKDNSFVFSESQFFNEYLKESVSGNMTKC